MLFGKWFEPEPLALLLGEGERKVSIEINTRTKKPIGLALTHEPYIADAAMFSHAVNDAYVKFSRGEAVAPLDAHHARINATVEATLKSMYR